MTHTRRALVIGGGIAGPVTAMALQKAGIEAVVHEARPMGETHGAFLTIASNGIDALRVLGADERVLAAAFPTPGITLRSGTGKRLGQVRTGRTADDGTTSRTIRRADLHRALREEALARGIAVEHGRRLIDAEDAGDAVRARFADGSEATGDVLVGCDGVHSTVRRLVDPAAPAPAYSGLVGTGGYARGVEVDADPGTYEMIFGRRAFFGFVVAPAGDVWWFANVPRPGEPARGELEAIDGEVWRGRLLDLFARDAGPATEIIGATEELLAAGPMHAVAHLPRWRSGRMVVAGDAAHAPSPTSGQGASLAVEDALELAIALRDVDDPAAALARFEAIRRPRVERIARWAERMNSRKAAGPVARVLRDAMLPAILRLTADGKALREIYDHHVDWGSTVAARTEPSRSSGSLASRSRAA